MELQCCIQKYHWGKVGMASEAAQLAKANNSEFDVDPDNRYAEFWMGTHHNGPSRILSTGETLHEWIVQNPVTLGDPVHKQFGVQLPFLFKVLSIDKPLSIQVHPSKSEAEELYEKFPDVYKDPNHKPEMAIALTPFEALCGFRPLEEIKQFLNRIPELRTCVGGNNVEALSTCSEDCQQEALRQCFFSLMTTPDDVIRSALDSLLSRISSLDESSRGMHLADLVERLNSQFPGDVGLFCAYLLNHLILEPGQAIYLAAKEPHAYLWGDCIECMACSDNTIRAGLTPKFKDVPTLSRLLSYVCEPASAKLFPGSVEDEHTTLFRPPVPDFAVAKISVPQGVEYRMIPRSSASISLVISGSASSGERSFRRGSVLFLPASHTLPLNVSSEEPLVVYQAMANV